MSTVDVLTGLRTGRFDRLRVKNPATGEYEDVVPGELSSQADLLQLYVGGVLYPATALAFNNSFSNFDPGTSTLQIGGPLYQGYVRIGSSSSYKDISLGAGGELLWDGAEVALAGSGGVVFGSLRQWFAGQSSNWAQLQQSLQRPRPSKWCPDNLPRALTEPPPIRKQCCLWRSHSGSRWSAHVEWQPGVCSGSLQRSEWRNDNPRAII